MQGGTGTSYAHSGETTEWEDILIKKGITSKEDVLLSKGLNPEDVSSCCYSDQKYQHANFSLLHYVFNSCASHLILVCREASGGIRGGLA
jgi:hypothetical protein